LIYNLRSTILDLRMDCHIALRAVINGHYTI